MVLKGRYKLLFNGVDLMQWIDGITAIERNIGQNRSATLMKVGRQRGETFSYLTNSAGTITVSALVVDPVNRRSLADAISTDVPMQLIFGDEPDKYYTAIADQQAAAAEAYHNNVVTLYFTVPDNVAHAVTSQSYGSTDGSPIAVTYNGTAPSYPILTQTMTGDNGLVGWINDSGVVLQFGDPEEVDGIPGVKNDTAFFYDFNSEPAGLTLNDGVLAYPNFLGDASKPNLQQGTIDWTGTPEAAVPVFSNAGSQVWAGPSFSGNLTGNVNGVKTGDFEFVNRFNITTSKPTEIRAQWTLQSADQVALSIAVACSSKSIDDFTVEFWHGDDQLIRRSLSRKQFPSGQYEVYIKRTGDDVLFQIGKVGSISNDHAVTSVRYRQSFTFAGFSDTSIESWTIWAGQYANVKTPAFAWTNSYFKWINEPVLNNIPNSFSDGDVVVIDVGERTVYVNGVESDLMTIGNDWDGFAIESGTSLQPITSSWAKPTIATVTIREAYL